MKKSKSLAALVAALVALTAASGARAQGDATVSLKVDLVAWGDTIEGLTLKGSGGAPVTAQPFRYSKSLNYTGPVVMEIHQSGASAPEDAPSAEELAKVPAALAERRKKSPTLVALAMLPTGSKRATVLLAPAPGGVYQAHVVDCDPSKVPLGKFCVLNLSPHKIAMRFNNGAESKQLALKETCAISPVNGDIVYELAYEQDGEWIVQENSILPVPAEDQTMMVVLRSESELFLSSMGTRSGYLQLVTLRRGPREDGDIQEISKAERREAQREAEKVNREMDEENKAATRNRNSGSSQKKPK